MSQKKSGKIETTYIDHVNSDGQKVITKLKRIELLQRIYLPEADEAMTQIEQPIKRLFSQMPRNLSEYNEQNASTLFNNAINASNKLRELVEEKIHILLDSDKSKTMVIESTKQSAQ